MATTSVDQITGYGETVAYKAPCRLATTAPIALSGLQAIDGSTTVANDRVLVKDQADARENGIYIASTGLWARARDMDSNRDITKGTRLDVTDGTVNGSTVWKISASNPINIGTSDITFVAITFGPISVIDEDDMASNSDTAVPTQQSVKAYTDAGIATRQPLDADLTAIAALATTAYGRGLLTSASVAALSATWVNLQTGTGAVSRTIQNKFTETISVKDFGATGDGVTDDTAAIQAAETARAAVAGELIFPPGTYQISATNITVNRATGGGWRGVGQAMLRATANNTILCVLTGAVAGTTNKPFLVSNLHFHGGGFTGVRGVHEAIPYGTTIDGCTFTQMYFCASFIGGSVLATQTGWIQISNIRQYGGGSWAFYGFDDTKYLFHVELNNIHQVGTGSSANWENDFWIEGRRCVGLSINNCWSGSLDGGADGLRLRGDCQGVFVTNSTFVWPKIGINALTWTDTLKPAYVYMANVGVDQHATSAAEIEGRTWFITNVNFANGYARTNTGQACLIKSTCTDIVIQDALFAYDQKSGLVVQNGAKKIRVGNFTAENNNQAAGAFYDIDLGASPWVDVRLFGKNVLGTAGVNATGQRLINGVTSDAVSVNVTPVSTTAVITAEDLMTYTIPAATLKVGQRVRVRAWGTTAANANTKTGRLWFGSTNMGGWSTTLNAGGWEVAGEIVVTGASAQTYLRRTVGANNITQTNGSTATEATSGAIVCKFQGQNGVASAGDITCQGLTVEVLD